jgi:hypothetical protein
MRKEGREGRTDRGSEQLQPLLSSLQLANTYIYIFKKREKRRCEIRGEVDEEAK